VKWRDHIRLAEQMARAFDLEYFRHELVQGSIEPDKKKEVVHTWSRARRTTRARMYRARKAFLKGKMKKCARYLGIVSHFIEDGMVHGTMDAYSHSGDHSTVEGQLGARVDISSTPRVDSLEEGFVDGEFVFREIDGLVREGLSSEALGRALSVLGSAVLSSPEPPPELVESRRRFIARIKKPGFKILAAANLLLAAVGVYFFRDQLWILLIPFFLLLFGKPALFRTLARSGWILAGFALLGFIYYLPRFDWPRLILTFLLAAQTLYLTTVPDLSRWGEKWYLLPSGGKG
jgi:hypothetical protein